MSQPPSISPGGFSVTQIPTWSGGPVSPANGRAAPGTTIGGRYSLRSAVGQRRHGHGLARHRHPAAPRRGGEGGRPARRAWPPATATRCTSAPCARPAPPPRFQHPAVVQVYDVVTEAGRPWIVMELLDARSLADMVIEDGPVAPARGRQDRHRAARRAGGRARDRRAAPRRQAGQRADLRRRPLRADRLRGRPDAHRRAAHHARHGARLAALHLARAGHGPASSARPATCSRSA